MSKKDAIELEKMRHKHRLKELDHEHDNAIRAMEHEYLLESRLIECQIDAEKKQDLYGRFGEYGWYGED